MREPGLFDLQMRMDQIHEQGNPLKRLKQCVDWDTFRPTLETIRNKERGVAQTPRVWVAQRQEAGVTCADTLVRARIRRFEQGL